MLIGEQIVPLASRVIAGEGLTKAWFVSQCIPKITGTEPPPIHTASASVDSDAIEK
jgi:xanthosine utilization system XapX-like protein